ncbi:hypothetical protein O7606_14600 [Micromonospora sp. WMMD882]|uniref:hypothetical protein n=1 Tax=Micromonospora sp. WMMD882 TaxID=3015151 RepID=UPI00248D32D7|nr:hypothetical protein [Micromonospora sp. WMMD882]WBB77516.1 hypothetical protein O7606_14600 [Micromonospora sp. WMMD882]
MRSLRPTRAEGTHVNEEPVPGRQCPENGCKQTITDVNGPELQSLKPQSGGPVHLYRDVDELVYKAEPCKHQYRQRIA